MMTRQRTKMKRKFNLYLKYRVKHATHCYVESLFIMSWRSLRVAINRQAFWKETECNRVLFFSVSPLLPLNTQCGGVTEACVLPMWGVLFSTFVFLARKNKGCRNRRYRKETGRKKKRNWQKHFWGNSYPSSCQLSYSAILLVLSDTAVTTSILCTGI